MPDSPNTHTLPATTTAAQDRDALHTRHINLIWEMTQAAIAIVIVLANVAAAFYLTTSSVMLGNAFFLVIGFYFGRTNHARPKAEFQLDSGSTI